MAQDKQWKQWLQQYKQDNQKVVDSMQNMIQQEQTNKQELLSTLNSLITSIQPQSIKQLLQLEIQRIEGLQQQTLSKKDIQPLIDQLQPATIVKPVVSPVIEGLKTSIRNQFSPILDITNSFKEIVSSTYNTLSSINKPSPLDKQQLSYEEEQTNLLSNMLDYFQRKEKRELRETTVDSQGIWGGLLTALPSWLLSILGWTGVGAAGVGTALLTKPLFDIEEKLSTWLRDTSMDLLQDMGIIERSKDTDTAGKKYWKIKPLQPIEDIINQINPQNWDIPKDWKREGIVNGIARDIDQWWSKSNLNPTNWDMMNTIKKSMSSITLPVMDTKNKLVDLSKTLTGDFNFSNIIKTTKNTAKFVFDRIDTWLKDSPIGFAYQGLKDLIAFFTKDKPKQDNIFKDFQKDLQNFQKDVSKWFDELIPDWKDIKPKVIPDFLSNFFEDTGQPSVSKQSKQPLHQKNIFGDWIKGVRQYGGPINEDGLYYLHKDEFVLPPKQEHKRMQTIREIASNSQIDQYNLLLSKLDKLDEIYDAIIKTGKEQKETTETIVSNTQWQTQQNNQFQSQDIPKDIENLPILLWNKNWGVT